MVNEIILIDENPAESRLIQLMLEELNLPVHLTSFDKIADSIDYLMQKNWSAKLHDQAPYRLIIWSGTLVNLSSMSFLRRLRGLAATYSFCTAIYSDKVNVQSVTEAYQAGANVVLFKQADFQEALNGFEGLVRFWLRNRACYS